MIQRHYIPFRAGTRVVISFSLLGIFEERSFLSLLSLRSLIMEIGRRLCVVLVIFPCAASCRVYPLASTVVNLLLCYRGNVG